MIGVEKEVLTAPKSFQAKFLSMTYELFRQGSFGGQSLFWGHKTFSEPYLDPKGPNIFWTKSYSWEQHLFELNILRTLNLLTPLFYFPSKFLEYKLYSDSKFCLKKLMSSQNFF